MGGPGAFVMEAKDFGSFGQALISKLIAEVASMPATHSAHSARLARTHAKPVFAD
jgi:hypothetical protein